MLHTISKARASGVIPGLWKYFSRATTCPLWLDRAGHGGGRVSRPRYGELRLHYARTLDRWAKASNAMAGKVLERFDEAFSAGAPVSGGGAALVQVWRVAVSRCSYQRIEQRSAADARPCVLR